MPGPLDLAPEAVLYSAEGVEIKRIDLSGTALDRRNDKKAKDAPNSASLPIYAIDFLHDPLSPLNSRSNERLGSWAWLGIKEVFGRFKVTSDQDSSHYREHSFATLFHDDKLIMFAFCSPIKFVRRNQSARLGCGIQSKGCPRERKYQHRNHC